MCQFYDINWPAELQVSCLLSPRRYEVLMKGNYHTHENAEEEWTPIPVYEKSKPLVGRISYRAFIGDSSVCIFSIEFYNDRW
jgi:hypothetical protein